LSCSLFAPNGRTRNAAKGSIAATPCRSRFHRAKIRQIVASLVREMDEQFDCTVDLEQNRMTSTTDFFRAQVPSFSDEL
jgi:hypothetical protein